jgi:S1-C subfamily serine protease
LHVEDGDYRRDRDLAASEVRSGSTTYQARTDEVLLRIDAYSSAPSAFGSVRVISSPRRTATTAPVPNIVRPAVSLPPVPVAKAVTPPVNPVHQIPKDGNGTKVWLGMSLRNVTRDLALAYHLQQPSGLLVTKVDAWTPAGTSGVESGDILLALDGQRIADAEELQLKIREMTQGRTATLAVFRDGVIRQVEVNVGPAPGRVAQSAAVGVHQ